MKHIEISDETYEKIKDQLTQEESVEIDHYNDLVGKKWFLRTVTYHWVGKAVKQVGDFVQLENASWIADSGRWMQAIRDGKLSEVEPTGMVFVNIKSVVDFVPWKHELPKEQK